MNRKKCNEIILSTYTGLSKRSVSYIKQFKYFPNKIVDMFIFITNELITSYSEVKNNNSYFLIFL